MRSLASNESRVSATTEIQTVSEHDLRNAEEADGRSFLDMVASDTRSPEEELVERSHQARKAAVIATLRANLADETAALAILDLLLGGLPKRDIRAKLSMSEKAFWAADRKLSREIEKVANWRIDNGDETQRSAEELLLDSLLEFIAHAPKDELEAFLKETGQDRNELASNSKRAVAGALKTHGARKLAAAKSQHREALDAYSRGIASLPKTIEEKLALLTKLLTEEGAAGVRLSLAHRDLKSVPEEELDTILAQLLSLVRRRS